MKRVFRKALVLAMLMGIVFATTVRAEDGFQSMSAANYKVANGGIYSWCGFPGPCNVPTSAIVLLEKQGPAEVIIGDTFAYMIQISNRSALDMIAVTIEDALPEGFAVESIEPKPDRIENGKAYWNLGTIPAKTAKLIKICGKAMMLGCITSNANAKICYEMPLPLATRVVQCNVEIQKTLPEVAYECDLIPMCITVFNTGSYPATNVCVTDKLPAGLLTKDGKSEINISVGTLAVGAQKTFSIDLRSTGPGEYTNTACVTADRNCYATSSATVKVIGAKLELMAVAPMNGYICTRIPYEITVTNTGEAPARNVILTDTISGNFKVEEISDHGKMSRGRIAWGLGTLNPGESRKVCLWGTSTVEGQVGSEFKVVADCVEPKAANHCLSLIGVPGVLTSLKDDCDPVALGNVVTYTVTASNTGSRDSNNLQYTIRLDDGMEFVAGSGVTTVSAVDAKTVTFAPLSVLPIGKTAVWTVQVRATGEGDKRFTAELKTNELDKPVSKSESTNFYSPNMATVVAQ